MTHWRPGQIYDSLNGGFWEVQRVLNCRTHIVARHTTLDGIVFLWNDRIREYLVIDINETSDILRRSIGSDPRKPG